MIQLDELQKEIPDWHEAPEFKTGGVDEITFIVLLILCFPIAIIYACCAGFPETHNVEYNRSVREHNRKHISYNSYCRIQSECYLELKEKMWMYEHNLISESEINELIKDCNYWGDQAKNELLKINGAE